MPPCPLSRDVSAPCPRKLAGHGDDCLACRDDLAERAAILLFGQGTGYGKEQPTCATRAEADALAAKQAREAMPGTQRTLAD